MLPGEPPKTNTQSNGYTKQDARSQRHRRSKLGCVNCKRRKVKCDEQQPTCGNCIRFGIPCATVVAASSCKDVPSRDSRLFPSVIPNLRRGRGRPRRDWAIANSTSTSVAASTTPSVPTPSSSDSSVSASSSACLGLSIPDIETLVHYTSQTARSLLNASSLDDPIYQFYAFNVPKIGLEYHFVLNLVYAVTGYHLAYLQHADAGKLKDDQLTSKRHVDIAHRRFSLGLSEFLAALPSLNNENCQALYTSSMLICYCTFAAGPVSPLDLLLCDLDSTTAHPVPWLPLIHGVRTIRSSTDPHVLFGGLMRPLGPEYSPDVDEDPITCPVKIVNLSNKSKKCELSQINWEHQIHALKEFVGALAVGAISSGTTAHPHVSHTDTNLPAEADSRSHAIAESALQALDVLIPLYKATFPPSSRFSLAPLFSEIQANDQPIFSWLYTLKDDFVSHLQRREPLPLIILAYYTVLLRTMENDHWFMKGWAAHLSETVRRVLSDSAWEKWLVWPERWIRLMA